MISDSTVNETEKEKFNAHQADWWNTNGPLKTLHDINPTRMQFILNHTQLCDYEVLDVGCGGGILTEGLAKIARKAVGLDVVQSAIDMATNHAKISKVDVDYVCSPIESFPDHQFDVITCMEMLEHVDSPELVLKHCHRLLKRGGMLFLSTINRTPLAYAQVVLAAEYILKILPRQTHDYNKFIKPSELSAMCRQFDFDLVDIKGLKYNPMTRSSWLSNEPSVNYVMACKKT